MYRKKRAVKQDGKLTMYLGFSLLLPFSCTFSTSAVQKLEFSEIEDKQWDNDILREHTVLEIVVVERRRGFF